MKRYKMLDKDRGLNIAINMIVAGITGMVLLIKGTINLISKLSKKK